MDAMQFLRHEHQKARAVFGKLLEAPAARRGELWQELQPELKAHEEIEEACLYGPLAEETLRDTNLADWASDEHGDEADEIEDLIGKIEGIDPQDERWLVAVREIHVALERHIRREESEIFPRVLRVWDQARLDQAGEEMSGMKAERAGGRGRPG